MYKNITMKIPPKHISNMHAEVCEISTTNNTSNIHTPNKHLKKLPKKILIQIFLDKKLN